MNAEAFAAEAGKPAILPSSSKSKEDSNLADDFARLTAGWALSQITPAQSEFVSKLEGFAVLGPDRTPLAVGGSLTPAALDEILAQEGGKNAFAKSVQENAVVSEALPGDEHRRLALVPAMEDGKLARVYAFTVDQTAAAGLPISR